MRMFNVRTDSHEKRKIKNAIQRLKIMIDLGRYDSYVADNGQVTNWRMKRARHMISVYEKRLREL